MMELIPPNTRFDFIGFRRTAAIISLVVVLLSLGLVLVLGPKLGIDFAGGSLIQARFPAGTTTEAVRGTLGDIGHGAVDIQDLGGEGSEFLLRLPLGAEGSADVNDQVTAALKAQFGPEQVEILRVEAVGPRVGEALRGKAIMAVLFATVMMGIYIWIRFEWRFGLGAAVALLHDVIVTLGFLVAFGYEFDLTIVAALLTVVGFSVNDTVIISDRIRENRRKDRRSPLAQVINQSVNETLSRTILTTGTGVLVVASLYLLGGPVIHGFAFTLLIGFIVGTYSSVFISSPVVLYFEPTVPSAAPERAAGRASTAASRRS